MIPDLRGKKKKVSGKLGEWRPWWIKTRRARWDWWNCYSKSVSPRGLVKATVSLCWACLAVKPVPSCLFRRRKKRNKIWNMGSSRSFYLLAKFPRLLAISPSVLLNFFLLLLLSYPEALPYGTLRSWSAGVISGSQKYREKLEWIAGSTQDTLSISSTRYTHICDI